MRNRDTRRAMARNLGKRGAQTQRHLYGCVTMACEMYLESPLERMVARVLDIDPRVLRIFPQPFCIDLESKVVHPTQAAAISTLRPLALRGPKAADAPASLYTPDFLIGLTDPMPLLVEVKSSKQLLHLAAEMEHKRQAVGAVGYRMIVITDEHVGHKGLESNLATLRDATKAFRRQGMTAELRRLQEAAARLQGSCTWGQLTPQFPNDVLQMGVAAGVLGVELHQGLIGRDTSVWPAHGDLSHLQLLNFDEPDDLLSSVDASGSKAHAAEGNCQSVRPTPAESPLWA